MFAGGFQSQTQKVGVVDLQSVFSQSDLYQQRQSDLKAMGDARSDVLNFLNTYPTITSDQAQTLKTLSLKTDLTPSEKTQLDKLKSDVQASDSAFQALEQKQNPTPDELAKLKSYNDQRTQTGRLYDEWTKDFTDDINTQKDKYRQEVLDKVTTSVQDYAKKQGYTMVFASDVAPFGTNDVTTDALKVMNGKK